MASVNLDVSSSIAPTKRIIAILVSKLRTTRKYDVHETVGEVFGKGNAISWLVRESLVIQHFQMAVCARIMSTETKLCVVLARLEPSASQNRQAMWKNPITT